MIQRAGLTSLARCIPHHSPHREVTLMRYIAVRALWACADVLDIVRDGLIVLAAKAVTHDRKAW